jgi:hypothetical protein
VFLNGTKVVVLFLSILNKGLKCVVFNFKKLSAFYFADAFMYGNSSLKVLLVFAGRNCRGNELNESGTVCS